MLTLTDVRWPTTDATFSTHIRPNALCLAQHGPHTTHLIQTHEQQAAMAPATRPAILGTALPRAVRPRSAHDIRFPILLLVPIRVGHHRLCHHGHRLL